MAVDKLEVWVIFGKLAPQTPDTEMTFSNIDIMEQHYGSLGQLAAPGFEVMSDGLVDVGIVDVQQAAASKVERTRREKPP